MPPQLPEGAIVNTGHLQKMTHVYVICVEFQPDGAQWFAYSLDGTQMASLSKLPYEATGLFEDPLEMISIAEQRLAIGFQPKLKIDQRVNLDGEGD